MEQNKKEIIVDDLEELRNCLIQGYKKVIVTEALSCLIVSTPSLVNEFYIFSSGAEERSYPTPSVHDNANQIKLEKIAKKCGLLAIFFLLFTVFVILMKAYLPEVIYYISTLAFVFMSVVAISIKAFIAYKQYRPYKDKYYYKAKYDRKKGTLSFKKKKYYFFAYLPFYILEGLLSGI